MQGNGVTSVFSFSFVADTPSEIQVLYTDTDGLLTLLEPSQYTLFLNAPNGSLHSVGGTVTYSVSDPIANGTSLTISRVLPLVQSTSISNQGDFYPTVVEDALDNLCLEIQQVSARTGKIRGVWAGGIAYNFSDIVQDGANGLNTLNYYQCAIANTSSVWATDLAAGDWSLAIDVQHIQDLADEAEASAVASAASAVSASTSASGAATSASNASTSASNAAGSAAAALISENNAATSASSASTSASGAATSASSASTSASNAAASATTATTQAGIATTQAGLASTYATAAGNSATAAAASAAIAAGLFFGTSTTSNSIGTGTKTFTTQSGLAVLSGSFVTAADSTNSANYIHGQVTSYSGTTLVIDSLDTGGSGTLTSWNISLSSPQGPAGIGSGTVNSGTAGRLAYYAGTGTAVSGNANLTISNGAATLGQASSVQGSLLLSGSTSGTTTLAAPVAGTGTMTLQAGTDTIVGRATIDTLTNKTLASATDVLGGVTMTLGSDGTGDMYYRSAGGILTRLANGGVNTVLHGSGSVPGYSAVVEGDISLSDITTNNATSAAHGFAPKAPADATMFLNGAATPAYAAVKDSDLSTTDITTNNVTSSKHGFAPKSGADATLFLNGAATPDYAAVKDSDLSTSDITTNNVSITKHGFAPKLPNDASLFLDGTGNYTASSGSTSYQAVGTYGIYKNLGSTTAGGVTIAGSSLQPTAWNTAATPVLSGSGSAPSGTWRNMGASVIANGFGQFVRVV